jgi:hypothetical protein
MSSSMTNTKSWTGGFGTHFEDYLYLPMSDADLFNNEQRLKSKCLSILDSALKMMSSGLPSEEATQQVLLPFFPASKISPLCECGAPGTLFDRSKAVIVCNTCVNEPQHKNNETINVKKEAEAIFSSSKAENQRLFLQTAISKLKDEKQSIQTELTQIQQTENNLENAIHVHFEKVKLFSFILNSFFFYCSFVS